MPESKIVHQRHVRFTSDRGEFGGADFGGKSLDAVIGGMNLEDHAGLRTKRSAIILGMRAVGRAYFDQLRPGPRHNVRHAESAADLDQLAARDDRLAAVRQCVQAEKHSRRIVVDERRILRAGERAKEASHMIVALAALARRQVKLQRAWLAHGRGGRFYRRLGEHGAAEVGMQHRAGEVEQRSQTRAASRFKSGERFERQFVRAWRRGRAGPQRRARLPERYANRARRLHATEALQKHCSRGGVQNGVYGWQIAQTRWLQTFQSGRSLAASLFADQLSALLRIHVRCAIWLRGRDFCALHNRFFLLPSSRIEPIPFRIS